MSDCNYYLNIISLSIDNEATKEQEAQLLAHMETCPDCARVYSAFRGISEAMPEGLAEPPAELASGTMFKIRMLEEAAKNAEGKTGRRSRLKPYLAAAACLVLVIAGAFQLGLFDLLSPQEGGGDTMSKLSEPALYKDDIEAEVLPPADAVPDFATDKDASQFSGNSGSEEAAPAPEFVELTGLLNAAFTSNTQFVESEFTRLQSAAEIAVYEGEYLLDDESYRDAMPLRGSLDKKSRETLFELITAETLLTIDDEAAKELEIHCTLIFYGVALPDSVETENLTATVWIYNDYLYFRLSSEPPIIYRSETLPIDFEDFIAELAESSR